MLGDWAVPIGFAICGWTQSVLLSLQTWESVRFARRRVARGNEECLDEDARLPTGPGAFGREKVAVLVPCKGSCDDLRSNLQPLFEQSYANYEIILLIESPADGANEALLELTETNRHLAPARIVYTGRAVESGQKVHNLLQATEVLDDGVAILAFVDSDACPGHDWLRHLMLGLDQPDTGAITGYRWMIPLSDHPANLMVYSLNSALGGLMGPGGHYSVWGGSWAIRRQDFDSIGLREAWQGTLSDDLVATRALKGAGLKVRFAPNCVSRSEIDNDWRASFEFIRRQYLIARRYAPRLWSLGLASHLAAQGAIWGSLAWALLGHQTAPRIFAAATAAALYGMAVLRGYWRQRLVASYAPEDADRLEAAIRIDIWLSPIIGLVNLGVLIGSAFSSQIQWRGIRYWISPGGRVLTLGRQIEVDDDTQPVILKFPSEEEKETTPSRESEKRRMAA